MARGRLTRNKEAGWLGGVCSGLADHFGQPLGLIRIGALIVTAAMPLLGWVYLGMWRSLPKVAAADDHLTVNMGLARLRSCQQRLVTIEAEILQSHSALRARIDQATPKLQAARPREQANAPQDNFPDSVLFATQET